MWQDTLRMLCYRSATLLFTDFRKEENVLAIDNNLQKLVDLKQHGYVRKVRLAFSLYQLCLDSTVIEKLREFFRSSGRMHNVQELEVQPYWRQVLPIDSPFSHGDPLEEFDEAVQTEILSNLMNLVHEYMPRVSSMTMRDLKKTWWRIPNLEPSVKAIEQLSEIVQSPQKLVTENYSITKRIVAQSQSCLAHVSITKHIKGLFHVRLIQSNAKTLESIYLEKATLSALVRITQNPAARTTALTYPKLKKLSVITCSGKHTGKMFRPQMNPFPVLEEFVVRGQFPFVNPQILKDTRHTMRVLRLEIDQTMMLMLNEHEILESNFFPNLEHISMGFPLRHRYTMNTLRDPLFVKTMAISKNLKVAKMHD
ncbi:hypothetical protein FBU59_006215, partial [Linderina macrospora]